MAQQGSAAKLGRHACFKGAIEANVASAAQLHSSMRCNTHTEHSWCPQHVGVLTTNPASLEWRMGSWHGQQP